jgi:hypothetical protein
MQQLPMKIRLTRLALFAAASVFTAAWLLPLAAQGSDSCPKATLPSAASELLKTTFPSWRPKQLSDLDADDRQLWLKAHDELCPGVAVGHFKSADETGYALLLVPSAKPTGGYKLIVLSRSQSGQGYTANVLDQAEGQTYSGLVISTAAPGRFSDFESTKSVQLKLDSIYLEWIEKGAQLFYWSRGRYHKLQVSD